MGASAIKSASASRGRSTGGRSVSRDKAGPDARTSRRAPSTRVGKAAKQDAVRRRRVMVAGGLVATLTITSALLLAMQPAPLGLESAKSLMSLSTPREVDALFQTSTPLQAKRWKYVYIHHAGAPSPAAAGESNGGPADHFVIGNGVGAGDGEIQVGPRWDT